MEAQEILDDDDCLRRFRSIYFPMKEEQFADMSDEIESFLNKLKTKFGSREFTDKKMFKLNLNAFSVTETYKKELET